MLSKFYNFPYPDQNDPIGTTINSFPVHIIKNPHTKLQPDRSSQVGLCLITRILSKFENFKILDRKLPPSVQQLIAFLYTSSETHTPNFSLISPVRLDFAGLKAENSKNIEIPHLPHFPPKMTPIGTTSNSVPVHIVRNPHTEFQLHRSSQAGLCLIIRILSKFDKFPISTKNDSHRYNNK